MTNTFHGQQPMSGPLWTQIGDLQGAYEYPQHAGLSTDGRFFMLVEYTGIDYFVMEIATQKIVWQSDWLSGRTAAPQLTEWLKGDFVEIENGTAAGRYRIFGLDEGEPLLVNSRAGLSLELDTDQSQLILRDFTTKQETQRLDYLPSADWTFASFSDDGSVIAAHLTQQAEWAENDAG